MGYAFSVLSDAPVGRSSDKLQFVRYVDPLVEILTNDATETPFTIGVFGPWGSGKSSLLTMVDQALTADYPGRFVCVHFNAWLHRKEPSVLLPLLHTLQDALAGDRLDRFAATVRRLGTITVRLSADLLLRKATSKALSMKQIDEAAEQYAKQRGLVESELRNLRATLQEHAEDVQRQGARLVLFIDDLDRCEPAEIIDLLESIKLFLDIRNVFVLIALAKDVVDRGVAVKYRDFGFALERMGAIGDEYLDKMVQLPLALLPIDADGVGGFIDGLDLPDRVRSQAGLLREIVTPNPRRIKRVLNSCVVTFGIVERSASLADLRDDLIVRLVVLRIQSPEVFAAVVARPDLLIALELTYQGRLDRSQSDGGWVQQFGTPNGEPTRQEVNRLHTAEGHLPRLFADSAFADIPSDLARYLTLLGG